MVSRNLISALTAAGLLAVLSSSSRAQGAAVPGDVGTLVVTVASVEPCGKTQMGAIVTLKVENRGKSFAEPLVFDLTPKDGKDPIVLRRAPAPYAGRYGRPAAPGGSQTYAVLFAREHARLAGAKARVADASFYAAAPPADVPVEVGTPRTDKRMHERGATIEFAVLPLKNLRDTKMDVTVRATFDRPLTETVLIHRRLEPKQELQASFTDLAYEPPDASYFPDSTISVDFVVPRGARIASAKLVDWCAVGDADTGGAAKLFREAYAKWIRWENGAAPVSGTYAAVFRSKGGQRESKGSFGLAAGGAVALSPEPGVSQEDSQKLNRAVGVAFRDLRRPPADEALALCNPKIERIGPPAVLLCEGKAWSEFEKTKFAIEGGRFLGHGWSGGNINDVHVDWILESFEGGYVVAERREFNIGGRGKPTEVHRWRYGRIDGLLVPLKYSTSEDLSPTVEPWALEVAFQGVHLDAAAAKPVESAATETVRAAWNNGYRHAATRTGLTCRVVVKPGKDGVWRSVKEAKGRITFTDFAGLGRGKTKVDVEGVADESLRTTLATAIDDRLGMWSGRDFGLRGEFDAVFAGASFEEKSPGVYDVKNGPYRTVTIKDGRISILAYPDGTPRTLTWSRIGDRDVVTRVVTGPEDLTASFTAVGPLLVPTRMVFKGVFGDEKQWGTEELTLSDFALR